MLPALAERVSGLDWDQARSSIGDFLGLSAPLPAAALRRAMVEDRYCFALFARRGNPRRLDALIVDPQNRSYELVGDGNGVGAASRPPVPAHSTSELMVNGGKALARWTQSGFAAVEPETFERRFAACQACPELVEPPEKWIYKVTLLATSDDRVCAACGCVASRKARLPTERCPRRAADDPSLNRWGEPFDRPPVVKAERPHAGR